MPVSDEIKVFTSSAYAVFNAVDELRQKFNIKFGGIVPVSQTEIAKLADLSQTHTSDLIAELEKDGWLSQEGRRGIIQLRALPQIKVRQ